MNTYSGQALGDLLLAGSDGGGGVALHVREHVVRGDAGPLADHAQDLSYNTNKNGHNPYKVYPDPAQISNIVLSPFLK